MQRVLLLGLVLGSPLPLCLPPADSAARAQEPTRIAPASNRVEIDDIHVERRAARGAAKGADLTNMRLKLWFAADWKTPDGSSSPLIHIQELAPIEDDTGRVLSTAARSKQIEYLRGEVRGKEWQSTGGKGGPVIDLLLDAPARGAAKLKGVKGKALVTLTKPLSLTFTDLAAVNGKVLDHPDLKVLAAMKLRFSVEEKDGGVSARLSAPVNFASPWNRGRLRNWEVRDAAGLLSASREATKPEGEGVVVERTYRRGSVKGLSLRLTVLEAVESKTFDFEFRDVELP